SPLFELPEVVVTPHLGASTVEAQDRAGTDVAESVLKALAGEFVPDAVNVSGGRVGEEVAGWLDLARKLGLASGKLLGAAPVAIEVTACGQLSTEDVEVLGLSAVRGLRSEEHTSELQSRFDLVCRILLEKKNNIRRIM